MMTGRETTAEALAAIPRVDAIQLSHRRGRLDRAGLGLVRGPGGTPGGARRSRRRVLAAVLLTPVLYVGYLAFSGLPAVPGLGWMATLAAMAVLGAATLASYIPQARSRTADQHGPTPVRATPPCAASGALAVPLAALIVSGATQSAWSGGFALAILALAAVQRMWAPASCAAPSPR